MTRSASVQLPMPMTEYETPSSFNENSRPSLTVSGVVGVSSSGVVGVFSSGSGVSSPGVVGESLSSPPGVTTGSSLSAGGASLQAARGNAQESAMTAVSRTLKSFRFISYLRKFFSGRKKSVLQTETRPASSISVCCDANFRYTGKRDTKCRFVPRCSESMKLVSHSQYSTSTEKMQARMQKSTKKARENPRTHIQKNCEGFFCCGLPKREPGR